MASEEKEIPLYEGFEQGPIRPPSEAASLLIRITRNCPWNRCTFCPVYKGSTFSLRPTTHVLRDIDVIHGYVVGLREISQQEGALTHSGLQSAFDACPYNDPKAFQAALHWVTGGMHSIFLQDADSLILHPQELITILEHLKHRFPWVTRMTSYARSHTVARIKEQHLAAMRKAGLTRIHMGLESGSDEVLKQCHKGATREMHITAGLKVKAAGMELSEYVMPGLGGKELSTVHAVETAAAINRIDPDFIRLRTLAVPLRVPIFRDMERGIFRKCTDRDTAEEILTFIEHLDNISSVMKSDHMLNLFQEIEGAFPEDKAAMTAVIRRFLEMSPREQHVFQIGRRRGILFCLADMDDPHQFFQAEQECRKLGVAADNIDDIIDSLMSRFV